MKTIVEYANSDKSLRNFMLALNKTQLVNILANEGPFTVFAPTNQAFEKLPTEFLDSLLSAQEKLTSVLKYHIVGKKIFSKDLKKICLLKTLQGQQIDVEAKKWLLEITIKIGCARIIESDIECKNGIIHKLNSVLVPKHLKI